MKPAFDCRQPRRQRGATLLVALIMLVMLTLFAVSMIRSGNVGLKVVGNQQTQKLMEAAAQQAIEQVVSNLGNFDVVTLVPPTMTVAQRVCINSSLPVAIPPATCPSGTQVDVAPARCISSAPSLFDSLTQPNATRDNVWEIVATVTDSATGARAVVAAIRADGVRSPHVLAVGAGLDLDQRQRQVGAAAGTQGRRRSLFRPASRNCRASGRTCRAASPFPASPWWKESCFRCSASRLRA